MTHSHAPAPPAVAAVVATFPPSVRRVHRVLLEGRNFSPTAEHPGATVMRRSVIAAKAGVDESTVRRATTALAKAGVIAKLHRGRSRAMAYFHAIRKPFDMPDGNRNQPVLMLALPGAPELVDNRPKKEAKKEARVPEKGGESPPQKGGDSPPLVFQETFFQDGAPHPTSFTAVGSNSSTPPTSPDDSRPRARAGGGSEFETNHETTATTPVDRVRARLGNAWPRDDRTARRLVTAALASGWTPDVLVDHLRQTSAGYRNPGAGVLHELGQMTPPPPKPERVVSGSRPIPPRDPDAARRGAAAARAELRARKTKDARDETDATEVPATSPVGAPDVFYAIGSAIGSGRRDAAFLGASEGVTGDMAATGTGG